MERCPKCDSRDIHRSRAKSKWENWRKSITGKRPFRCRACKWRGWGVDPGPVFTQAEIDQATRAIAPEPPNLKGTVLASTRSVAPQIDLNALDRTVGARDDES